MQATFTVTQVQNCTLLHALLQMQQCSTIAQMLQHCDSVLDELNGCYTDDMEQAGCYFSSSGDVVFTQHCTQEHVEHVTGRAYVQTLLNVLDDGEDASYNAAQRYCMLAIVQRDMFVEDTL